MKNGTLKEIAFKAFRIRDLLIANESGGTEPSRIWRNITVDDDLVDIEYTYMSTGGLSDRTYHSTNKGKKFHETYRLNGDRIYLMNNEGKWISDIFSNSRNSKSEQLIRLFYKAYGLIAPETTFAK